MEHLIQLMELQHSTDFLYKNEGTLLMLPAMPMPMPMPLPLPLPMRLQTPVHLR